MVGEYCAKFPTLFESEGWLFDGWIYSVGHFVGDDDHSIFKTVPELHRTIENDYRRGLW